MRRFLLAAVFLCVASVAVAQVQTGTIRGKVTDEMGGVLPGVTAEARLLPGGVTVSAVTDGSGDYAFEGLAPGRYLLTFTLINFGTVSHRDIDVGAGVTTDNPVMHLALNAEVTVIGKRTFANLADVAEPGRKSRRHRAVGEPGRDHGAATGRPAHHAVRRGA